MATRKYNTLEERILASQVQEERRKNDRQIRSVLEKWIKGTLNKHESSKRVAIAEDYLKRKKEFRESAARLERELYKSGFMSGGVDKPAIIT